MAVVTPSLLTSLMTGFKANYQAGVSMAESDYGKISTTVPSSSKSNTYGWLGQFPQFREWAGDRVINDISASGYEITNKDYESTIGVKRTDIEDDNLGIYSPLFTEMGRAATAHPDELVFSLLAAGFATNCYDGQYFFDTDHAVGAGSVSNIQAGTETPWYLLDTSRAIKPLVFQERKKAEFVSMTKSDDENVFTANQYRYGVDSRCNVGYGFWQMAFGSKAALTGANFNDAFSSMASFKSDEGRPLGIKPSILIVPPTLRAAALEIINAETIGGTSNTNRGAVDVVVSPWLA